MRTRNLPNSPLLAATRSHRFGPLCRSLLNTSNLKLWLRPGLPGAGTTWNDVATNVNNGTFFNSPTWAYDGVVFNGSNTYVELGTDSSLNITGPLTGSAWVKPNTLTMANLPVVLSKGYNLPSSTSGPNFGWNQISLGDSYLYVYSAGGGTNNGCRTSKVWGAADLNVWSHIAYTWDGTNWHMYVNGVEDTVQVASAVAPSSSGLTYCIGCNCLSDGTRNRVFDGAIRDVMVWNRALVAGEVKALYELFR